MVCFFSFLFFLLLISDKGGLGSYLQELEQDAKSKISRHLEARENMIQELSSSLAVTDRNIRKIILGSFGVLKDSIFSLQHIVKKLAGRHMIVQTNHHLSSVLV
jgi:hypothetical protein